MDFSSKAVLNAYKALEGGSIRRDEAIELIGVKKPYNMDLYSLANKVRRKYSKPFMTCSITNAKSGACSENCSFCAQSSHHSAKISEYPLRENSELLEDARRAKENGAENFCIVLSGLGYEEPNEEFLRALNAVREIIRKTGLRMHVSPGILSDETAMMLKKAGVEMINHNIETAPSYFDRICTTHSVTRRIITVNSVKRAGMKACSGGIIGLGESPEERVELAFLLKELDVDVIPLNIHQKIPGTRARENDISIREILNTVAVFRLVNPDKIIKIAAGRETILGDYQGLVFNAGANGMICGGYLTIPGRDAGKDSALLESL